MMIRRETLEFLRKLARNNNRAWFAKNRPLYEAARENVLDATMYLIGEIAKFDESVQGVGPDECLYRIFKDTRFSRDKSPYKTNFGSFIKSGGRSIPGAGYYLHLSPGDSFVSGGIYMPPAQQLLAIRNSIARNSRPLKKILAARDFIKEFGSLDCEALKTAPKGFPRDHPDIELLKFKHYFVYRELSDREVLSRDFLKKCVHSFMILSPFVRYLNIIMATPRR